MAMEKAHSKILAPGVLSALEKKLGGGYITRLAKLNEVGYMDFLYTSGGYNYLIRDKDGTIIAEKKSNEANFRADIDKTYLQWAQDGSPEIEG